LEALLISTGLVAIAEIGDKTQLLAIVLAARFRRPVPIILGILCATILNRSLAAAFRPPHHIPVVPDHPRDHLDR